MKTQALPPVTGLASCRARSSALFAALTAERRAAAGLVSVSTSGFGDLSNPWEFALNTITIDPDLSRVTRLRKAVGLGSKNLFTIS